MKRIGSVLAAVLALGFGATNAYAQVCGVDFYGPCLPDPAPKQETPKAKVDPMERNAFDEALFAGDDGLVKAVTFAETTGTGAGAIKAASTASSGGSRVVRTAAKKPPTVEFTLNSVNEDGPVADPENVHQGTRMDPVRTLARTPEGTTMVKVVAPMSATGRLDWMSTQAQNAPKYALHEESYNHESGLWEGAPKRSARTDLIEESRTMNFIRPTE